MPWQTAGDISSRRLCNCKQEGHIWRQLWDFQAPWQSISLSATLRKCSSYYRKNLFLPLHHYCYRHPLILINTECTYMNRNKLCKYILKNNTQQLKLQLHRVDQEQLLGHRQQLQQSVQEKTLESQTPAARMGPRGKDTAGKNWKKWWVGIKAISFNNLKATW